MIGGQEGQISEPQEKRKLELIICESETKKICSTKYLKESETEKNMFTQIFLSEIISIAENGGQGTHFLISQFLKGLTYCCNGTTVLECFTPGPPGTR